MLILILPWSKCQMPCMRRPHCRPKAARSRLTPTLLNPYRFRKVMRKPKPMKIMTWTSWNTAEMSGEVSCAADLTSLRSQNYWDLLSDSFWQCFYKRWWWMSCFSFAVKNLRPCGLFILLSRSSHGLQLIFTRGCVYQTDLLVSAGQRSGAGSYNLGDLQYFSLLRGFFRWKMRWNLPLFRGSDGGVIHSSSHCEEITLLCSKECKMKPTVIRQDGII